VNTKPEILDHLMEQAVAQDDHPTLADSPMLERVTFVCRYPRNRAPVRFLMACMLAKIDRPDIDPRKPYTEIGDMDAFSGRNYDESFILPLIRKYRLPCNTTTAFLTPAFRNITQTFTTAVAIAGRPPELYTAALQLLDDVHIGRVSAAVLLVEILRQLVQLRNEADHRLATLLVAARETSASLPLSAESVVKIVIQHLQQKNVSRLPVLVVAAAYNAAKEQLGEAVRPLQAHNAADEQTGALGDLEITLEHSSRIVTCYKMKLKPVTRDDIDRALDKILSVPNRVDNYIFITTEPTAVEVQTYAAGLYKSSGGVEIIVLDCIAFLRHFLHLFHRLRISFLDNYQELVLSQPDSAVSRSLKEAFLIIRQTAERLLMLGAEEA